MVNGTFHFQELIDFALHELKPQEATRYDDVSLMAPLVATPIITQIYDRQGRLVLLNPVDKKYAAGYVRVSSDSQVSPDAEDLRISENRDGASDEQQITQLLEYFVYEKQWQLRLYSDVTLRGDCPWLEQELIEDMRTERANRYEDAFRKFLLNDATIKARGFSAEQVERIKRYLQRTRQHIMDEEQEIFEGERKRRHSRGKSFVFRPGLTVLMEGVKNKHIHAIVAYDDSRLARSHLLSVLLGRKLAATNTQVITFSGMGNAGSRKFEDVLTGTVMALMAEKKLVEVTENSLRGKIAKLFRDEAVAAIPWWLERKRKPFKKADFKPGAEKTVRLILSLFNGDDGVERGIRAVAIELERRGVPGPKDGGWNQKTIRDTLSNPALYGVCDHFGVEWHIYPVVISREEFLEIQTRIKERAEEHGVPRKDGGGHLLTGLLHCTCGRNLHFQSNGKYPKYSVGHNKVATKRPDGHEHVVWFATTIEGFFDSIMRYRPEVFCAVGQRTAEHEWLESQLAELRAQLESLENNRSQWEEEARGEAIASVTLKPDHPRYERTINALVEDYLADYEDKLDGIRTQISETDQRLRELPSPALILDTVAAARKWDSLSVREKNKLLCVLLKEIRLEQRGDGEFLVPVPRFAVEPIPPIPLKVTKYKNGRSKRRLPTPEEWDVYSSYLPKLPSREAGAMARWEKQKEIWTAMTPEEHAGENAWDAQHEAWLREQEEATEREATEQAQGLTRAPEEPLPA